MTTLIVTPTFSVTTPTVVSYSLYQGNGVNTASELASSALPTQLVFDTNAGGVPVGAATTGDVATMSVSPIFIGTASVAKSVVADTTSAAESTATPTSSSPSQSSRTRNAPVLAIILALVAVICIAMMFLFLWYRKRARRKGHPHSRTGSEEYGTAPPASGVIRKLGPTIEKPSSADPFSDAHAAPLSDPFADPEKPTHHTRTGSDSFLNMGPPRAPYTHAPSASTGSTASSRARKREMEEARKNDMTALNNLVRALDQKERQAQAEGRDRRSLPPVELFKAALIR